MSKTSTLLTTLDEMIQCGQELLTSIEQLQKCCEGMIKTSKALKEFYSMPEPAAKANPATPVASPTATIPAPATPAASSEKTYTFTEVRGTLAKKATEGFKKEIKELITKYGAEKLSDIKPENYTALIKDVEGLSHE